MMASYKEKVQADQDIGLFFLLQIWGFDAILKYGYLSYLVTIQLRDMRLPHGCMHRTEVSNCSVD